MIPRVIDGKMLTTSGLWTDCPRLLPPPPPPPENIPESRRTTLTAAIPGLGSFEFNWTPEDQPPHWSHYRVYDGCRFDALTLELIELADGQGGTVVAWVIQGQVGATSDNTQLGCVAADGIPVYDEKTCGCGPEGLYLNGAEVTYPSGL